MICKFSKRRVWFLVRWNGISVDFIVLLNSPLGFVWGKWNVISGEYVMTDLIDLATLASLGQHFSSHEDVAELKVALAGVQNDLALIKGFLLQQFGK